MQLYRPLNFSPIIGGRATERDFSVVYTAFVTGNGNVFEWDSTGRPTLFTDCKDNYAA